MLMRRLFSSFAHGAPGIGLLLLRLATASALLCHDFLPPANHAPLASAAIHALVILLSMLLFAGLWTPIAAMLATLITFCGMVSHPASWPHYAWVAVIAAALALLGPGAWSVDARLYGWKQIKISNPKRSEQDSAD